MTFGGGLGIYYFTITWCVQEIGKWESDSLILILTDNLPINPTNFNIISWVAWSIVPSIENKTVGCWFELRALKTLYFYFCKLKEYKLKGFLQEIMKKK